MYIWCIILLQEMLHSFNIILGYVKGYRRTVSVQIAVTIPFNPSEQ